MKYDVSFEGELKKNPYKGIYIAIEGIDGSGKSTQIKKLQEYFKKKEKKVVLTSEPKKDSLIGRLIKDILEAKIKVPSKAYQFLYSSDRVINHKEIVMPYLKKGDIVISHRCFWSIIPYGIFDRGETEFDKKYVDPLFVAQGVFSKYNQFIIPDITFYLDVNVDLAAKRLSKMKKKKEIYEKREKLAKIINGYKWLIQQFPREFVIIDGEKREEEVNREIINHVENIK